MSTQETHDTTLRRDRLRAAADGYFAALRTRDFSAIPYDDRVTVRAPLVSGGTGVLLAGKKAVQEQWWEPLLPVLDGIEITVRDYYFNDSLTAIVAEAEIAVPAVSPPATVRMANRFTVDEHGRIIEQVSHYDPRDVTDPGR